MSHPLLICHMVNHASLSKFEISGNAHEVIVASPINMRCTLLQLWTRLGLLTIQHKRNKALRPLSALSKVPQVKLPLAAAHSNDICEGVMQSPCIPSRVKSSAAYLLPPFNVVSASVPCLENNLLFATYL